MILIFSYGKKVEPNHDKLNAFTAIAAKYGIKTRNVTYNPDATGDERIPVLLSAAREASAEGEEIIYAGTSMGCYGSLIVSKEVPAKGMFLVSPALFMKGYAVQEYPLHNAGQVEMVVGHQDTVIPRMEVSHFVMEQHLEAHFVDDTHAMSDSLETLKALFDDFLRKLVKG